MFLLKLLFWQKQEFQYIIFNRNIQKEIMNGFVVMYISQ